jgi:hypothetical protein
MRRYLIGVNNVSAVLFPLDNTILGNITVSVFTQRSIITNKNTSNNN